MNDAVVTVEILLSSEAQSHEHRHRLFHQIDVQCQDSREFAHVRMFIRGDEQFVEQDFEIIANDPVHHEARAQRRHLNVVIVVDGHVQIDQALAEERMDRVAIEFAG